MSEQLTLFDNFGNVIDESMERIACLTKTIQVHEFQAGVIYTYKALQKVSKNVTSFFSNAFCIKNVLYDISMTEEEFAIEICKNDILSTKLYSKYKPEKRIEVCYDLNKIFERSSYAKSKSYYKSVARPFNICSRYNFTIRRLNQNDLKSAKNLLYKWIEIKLSDPKVFRMMFPEKRYERCLDCSISLPYWCNNKNGSIENCGLFDNENNLLGFRIVYVLGSNCYDLAYITNREYGLESFSEVFEAATLKYIKDTFNVTFFNCGLSQGDLKSFKQKTAKRGSYILQI